MGSLYRLSDTPGSPGGEPDFQPPFSSEYDTRPQPWAQVKKLWRTYVLGQVEPETPSGYLTLIPLNDSRLKPRRTTLLVALLLVFALSAATATFFLVPRGVSLGEIDITSDRMSWNTSKGTYQLNLLARIPVYNPNYMNVKMEGRLSIFFYDTEAGSTTINITRVAARSNPHVLEVVVDASNVPLQYALTILSECAAFPRRLIFFLKGSFTATYTQRLSFSTDSYFMIDCLNGGGVVPSPGRRPPPPGHHRSLDASAPPPVPLVGLETEAAGMQQGSRSSIDNVSLHPRGRVILHSR